MLSSQGGVPDICPWQCIKRSPIFDFVTQLCPTLLIVKYILHIWATLSTTDIQK